MLRAAVYARYSSGLQKSTSAQDQISLCRDAAPRFDCTILDDHIYADLELSGTIDQRPGYQRLLTDAKDRKFQAIIIESQDRLWRDQGEMHHALKRLRFWGIKVFSVSTGNDIADDTGKLMATIVGLKDEVFIEDLRKKTRRGMMGQIRRGMNAGGRSYGYRSEPISESGQVVGYRRVIDQDQAKVVRRIFKMYSQGKSPRTIAHTLNAERVPSPRPRKGQRSLGWTPLTISGSAKRTLGILHNPLYVGRILWNRSQKVRDPDTGKRTMRPRPNESRIIQ
jgi:DNA invertase Pin-like site-specific DNA recombinase